MFPTTKSLACILLCFLVFYQCQRRRLREVSGPSTDGATPGATARVSDLGSAIHEWGSLLRSAEKPSSLNLAQTNTDSVVNANDLEILARETGNIGDETLLDLFHSPQFMTLKHDIRAVMGTQQESTGLGLADSTSTSTSTNTENNWFSWMQQTNASGETQLTLMGMGVFFVMAAYSALATRYILYPQLKGFWPQRKFFASMAFMRMVSTMGLSVGYLFMMVSGGEGMSEANFETGEGVIALVNGISLSLFSLASLYEEYRSGKNYPMGSFPDIMLDPENRASLKGKEELKMKWDYYSFIRSPQGEEKEPGRSILKRMSQQEISDARELANTPESEILKPSRREWALNQKIVNPYSRYLSLHLPLKSPSTSSASKPRESSTKSRIQYVDVKGKKVMQVRLNQRGTEWKAFSVIDLVIGLLATYEGLSHIEKGQAAQGLALVDPVNPSTQYFRNLMVSLNKLFDIHDAMYGR